MIEHAQDFSFETLYEPRRMVLVLDCASDDLLEELAEANVPCVGLDQDADRVEALRRSGIACWTGDWRTLEGYRARFDLIRMRITTAQRESLAESLAMLSDALLPGGIVLLESQEWLEDVEACLPPSLQAGASVGLRRLLHETTPSISPERPDAIRPFADAFAGCRDVLELAPGAGHFLAALHVRDIGATGVEAEPEALADHFDRHDGVYCGNLFDRLDDTTAQRLLAFAVACVRPGGRFVARVAPPATRVLDFAKTVGLDYARLDAPSGETGDHLVFGVRRGQDAVPEFLRRSNDPTAKLQALLHDHAPFGVDIDGRPIDAPLESIDDLERFEHRESSQGGEDGILAAIFALIGTTNRYYVEFGCGDAVQCNTAALRKLGWTGLLMDGMAAPATDEVDVHAEWIDADNINELFTRYEVPAEPDLVSIDLDGNDYWVWRALDSRPRVVIAEYNANISPAESLVMPYDPDHKWNGTDYYGASLLALSQLGDAKGYKLVYCNSAGVNAFFVRGDLIPGFESPAVEAAYRAPNFWYRGYRQVPDLGRQMVDPNSEGAGPA